MSVVRNVGKAAGKSAKFVAITMPLSILGWKTFMDGNKYILKSVSALNSPTCPQCLRGGLQCDMDHVEEGESDISLYSWRCSNKKECDFALFAPNDIKEVRKIVADLTARRGMNMWEHLDEKERLSLIAGHKRRSRFFWALTVLIAVLFVYMIASGAPILTVVNMFGIILFLTLSALKGSYRAWQVENGVLFQQGAFKRFVLQEKWIR